MKTALSLLVAGAVLASASAADPQPPTTQKERASYGIGMNIAKRFKHDLLDLDIEAFMRGFKDALTDKEPAVPEAELKAAMDAMMKEVESKATAQATDNKKKAEAFLAANKTKEGVKATESGLQYKVLKEGTGPMPKPTDIVKVHYRGTLMDGTEFDSSYKRGEPITFPVRGVIPGWIEALQLMKVGSKWQLWIPSDLAYGDNGQGEIPPGAMLIFEVELLGIEASPEI